MSYTTIKAKAFEFTSYSFKEKEKKISFRYSIIFDHKPDLKFCEEIVLPKTPQKIPAQVLNKLLESLHIVLGLSYYKLYCPKKIIHPYAFTKEQADFWNLLYKKGLGEFCYRNKIDSKKIAKFDFTKNRTLQKKENAAKGNSQIIHLQNRSLLGIGGGKDSIVAGELLKESKEDFTAFLLKTGEDSKIQKEVIKAMGVKSLQVQRKLDPLIFAKHEGSYNGHIPISSIIAFLGIASAIFYNYSQFIVGNEYSSNFGNLKYKGEEINHQWSKSQEFESTFNFYIKKFISPSVSYFSLLRPFYEIRIVELFCRYKKYFPIFTSCNRAFKSRSGLESGEKYKKSLKALWCGECAKCVFMFIQLSAFLTKKEVLQIFNKDLLKDKNLKQLFEDILGHGQMKPFDCVGTFEEAKTAASMAGIIKKDAIDKNVFKTQFAPNLPAKYKLLGIKNVLILGYGKEGKVTENILKTKYPNLKIGIADKSFDTKTGSKNYLKAQENFDLIVKTPGMPKTLVCRPYTTATNLLFSFNNNFKIGITGSKGKSTTSSLIYEILKTAGKKVRLLGNIGNPMLEVLNTKVDPKEIFVIELSSYMLDDINYSPNIAVVLNLFPEHMNYHGNIKNYYEAKKNIIKFQTADDFFVYNKNDNILKTWASDSTKIPFAQNHKITKNNLIGEHNAMNINAAIELARLLKIPNKITEKAIANFKPLPHRLEFIGEFKDIKFYDDAISTTPESTIMAIKALKNIGTIFLGGEDRGYDFSELEKTIVNYAIKNIVLFPDSGKRMFKKLKGTKTRNLNFLKTSSMQEAVNFAYKFTSKKSICLLSTASPSYSLWKNFEEKGDQFTSFVKMHEVV